MDLPPRFAAHAATISQQSQGASTDDTCINAAIEFVQDAQRKAKVARAAAARLLAQSKRLWQEADALRIGTGVIGRITRYRARQNRSREKSLRARSRAVEKQSVTQMAVVDIAVRRRADRMNELPGLGQRTLQSVKGWKAPGRLRT